MTASALRLTSDRFYPVCAPGYQNGKVDLDSAVLLDCAGMTGNWSAWFKNQGKRFAREGEVNLASTFFIALLAAESGAGITMAHDTLVADRIANGSLVRPFEHDAPMAESYFLLPPAPHASTPASRSFVDWLNVELLAQSVSAQN